MDTTQLHELATNATLNHWPPHLGVRTEAEKIEYLTERLREVADAETRADELADQLETAQEENGRLSDENEDLTEQVKQLKSDVKVLHAKIDAAKDALS
jgi:predicted  nucleic acid-binding Zn-ribbon protein